MNDKRWKIPFSYKPAIVLDEKMGWDNEDEETPISVLQAMECWIIGTLLSAASLTGLWGIMRWLFS